MSEKQASYLLAGQGSELQRLQIQSRVWEPAGRDLLAQLWAREGAAALEVGCGVMGWLRILNDWVGPNGKVVGIDVDEKMLAGAQHFIQDEALQHVSLLKDDLFQTQLPAHSFDLVHSRFQIAPLGRADAQIEAYLRLLRPGGYLVVEDPDMGSWHVNPESPAVAKLIELIDQAFRLGGGNFNSGRQLPVLLRDAGLVPKVSAHVVALEADHPYLRLPIQFANALRPRLEKILTSTELAELIEQVEADIARPGVWGTTFTLIQAVAISPTR